MIFRCRRTVCIVLDCVFCFCFFWAGGWGVRFFHILQRFAAFLHLSYTFTYSLIAFLRLMARKNVHIIPRPTDQYRFPSTPLRAGISPSPSRNHTKILGLPIGAWTSNLQPLFTPALFLSAPLQRAWNFIAHSLTPTPDIPRNPNRTHRHIHPNPPHLDPLLLASQHPNPTHQHHRLHRPPDRNRHRNSHGPPNQRHSERPRAAGGGES